MAKGNARRGPVQEELERLYLQPPERFTAERDALANRLRAEGDREGAQEVKKLRKPSLAAWLVNQLGLREPDDVSALMATGERLRAAEEAMLSGSADPDELRAAAADEREALDRLRTRAREIAAEDGRKLNPATLDRVSETLQAAATDEDVAEAVRGGRLAKETKRATIGASARAPSTRRRGRARGKDDDATREREHARRALEHAEEALGRAEAHRDRSDAEVDRLSERLKEARAELAEAKRDVKAAETAVRRARKQAG